MPEGKTKTTYLQVLLPKTMHFFVHIFMEVNYINSGGTIFKKPGMYLFYGGSNPIITLRGDGLSAKQPGEAL